jgi:hypothetical protein
VQVAEVKALACQLPAEAGAPLSVWSCPELAHQAVIGGITDAISASTVGRDRDLFLGRAAQGRGPNDFTHLDQVRQRLDDFELRYNATARPFQWKFTPTDLDDLLAKIDRRQQQTTAPTIPQAA